jgi:hypothetical protein
MQVKRRVIWATGVAMALLAGSASAINCYTVLDRSDNIVYRGIIPPIDLSEKGQAERDAMRQRGQHLIAMDTDRCLGIEYFTGSAGSSALTVDQIVGAIPLRGQSPGGYVAPFTEMAPASTGSGSSGGAAPAPRAPATPAPAKRSTSSY